MREKHRSWIIWQLPNVKNNNSIQTCCLSNSCFCFSSCSLTSNIVRRFSRRRVAGDTCSMSIIILHERNGLTPPTDNSALQSRGENFHTSTRKKRRHPGCHFLNETLTQMQPFANNPCCLQHNWHGCSVQYCKYSESRIRIFNLYYFRNGNEF